jgi:predicted ester cyclase
MPPQDNKAAARRYIEVVNTKNLRDLDDLVDPNIELEYTGGPGKSRGSQGLKEVSSSLISAFPDLKVTVDDVSGDGDTVTIRWTANGTLTGNLKEGNRSTPATNKKAKVSGSTVLRFSQGKVVGEQTEFDRPGLMKQLGVSG